MSAAGAGFRADRETDMLMNLCRHFPQREELLQRGRLSCEAHRYREDTTTCIISITVNNNNNNNERRRREEHEEGIIVVIF